MNTAGDKNSIGEKVFYYSFICWFVSDIISSTTLSESLYINYSIVDRCVNVFVLILLVIRALFFQEYSLRQLYTVILIGVISALSALQSHNYNFFSMVIFVIASQGIDFIKVVKNVYKSLLVCIPTICAMCMLGVLRDVVTYRSGMVRHSLGFIHPNVLGIRVFQLCVCFLIINNRRIIMQMLFSVATAAFTYMIPNSKTAYITSAAIVVFLPIYYFAERSEDARRVVSRLAMIGVCIITFLILLSTCIEFSNYRILSMLDDALSLRLTHAHRAFIESGARLFGNVVYTTVDERRSIGLYGHLYLDCSYAILLVRYGLLVLVGFIVFYLKAMRSQARRRNLQAVMLLFVYAVYGIMEPTMFMLKYNIVLLLIADELYGENDSIRYKVCIRQTRQIKIL